MSFQNCFSGGEGARGGALGLSALADPVGSGSERRGSAVSEQPEGVSERALNPAP